MRTVYGLMDSACSGQSGPGVRFARQNRIMKGADMSGERFASPVEFVVAESCGIMTHEIIEIGQYGPAVDGKEERSLKLVARIHHQHIVLSATLVPHHCGDAAHAARAVGGSHTSVAVLVAPGNVGMGVVGMQQYQFKRLPGLPDVSDATREQQGKE